MPIAVAPTGQKMKILKILTDEKTKKHLENLGLTVNSEITVLTKSGGSVICLVKEGRLALDGGLVTKIFVS
ncbi:MAG: ferrous iron transport protein A [Clostridia bacterium]|nr:ferrous iron transport protein A [Clostridia bacterium]